MIQTKTDDVAVFLTELTREEVAQKTIAAHPPTCHFSRGEPLTAIARWVRVVAGGHGV